MQIFYSLLAVGMFIFAIYLAATFNPAVGLWVLLFPLTLTGSSVLIFINVYRRRIIIYDRHKQIGRRRWGANHLYGRPGIVIWFWCGSDVKFRI
jgi:hypothetical protein